MACAFITSISLLHLTSAHVCVCARLRLYEQTPTIVLAAVVGQVVPVLDPYLSPITTTPAALPLADGEHIDRPSTFCCMRMRCTRMHALHVDYGRLCSTQRLKATVYAHEYR